MLKEKDRLILENLKKNCKLTTKQISEKTGLPITTVHNRIKRMEKEGIILGYTTILDEGKIGKKLKAFIQISVNYNPGTKHISQEELAKKIFKLPEVEECYIMTGAIDILASVLVADVDELNNFIINKLREMDGVQNTLTAVVLSDVSRAQKAAAKTQ